MADLPQIGNVRHASGGRASHASGPSFGGGLPSRLPGFLSKTNVPFLLVMAVLVVYGLIVCASATAGEEDYSIRNQLFGVFLGIVVCVVIYRFNYHVFETLATPLLVVTVVLILLPHVPGIGVEAMGAKSWVKLGIRFQPGELAKITVILFAAALMSKYGGRLDDLKEYCKVIVQLAIPFVCIMTQPDLGTGLVYFIIAGVVVVVGGAKGRYIIGTIILIAVAFVALLGVDEILKTQLADGTYEYKLLKNYQRDRLFVFLNQDEANMTDEGYNLQQAIIAIGSGGAFGKGLGNATQSTLGFLPEAPTDFIFCVLSEELGFVGALFLIALYAALLYLTVKIGRESGSLFGMLICIGVGAMWLFQILENIGMCCGIMPITGIPLPFVSYGSSFMIVNFACVGLVANVWRLSAGGGVREKSKDVKYAKTI